jgi:hypothetical protein
MRFGSGIKLAIMEEKITLLDNLRKRVFGIS